MSKKNHCDFKNHKSVERKCANCDYVIEKTPNDDLALKAAMYYTGERPKCSDAKLLKL